MRTSILFLSLAIALPVLAQDQETPVYTWVDSEGVVHYADMPEGDGAEQVAVQSRRTNPGRIGAQRQAESEGAAGQRAAAGEQARTDAERAEIEQQNAAARADGCRRATAAYENYMTNRRFYKPLPNGERQWLTEEEVAAAKEAARQAMETYCD
jgi:hypothetical protein